MSERIPNNDSGSIPTIERLSVRDVHAMAERTVDDAMAHAAFIKQYDEPNRAESDLALLADEVLRLREENRRLGVELDNEVEAAIHDSMG